MNQKELLLKLKNTKTPKEKKWMYNMVCRVIELYESDVSYKKYQVLVNNYYKQHYHNYYTKKHRELSKDQRKKIAGRKMGNKVIRNKRNDHNRMIQRKKSLVLKMFNNGDLSKKSTRIIELKLNEVTKNEK